jgi:hypothetical protein
MFWSSDYTVPTESSIENEQQRTGVLVPEAAKQVYNSWMEVLVEQDRLALASAGADSSPVFVLTS